MVPKLPLPFILLGDFNGHYILWGSKDINDRGRIIEDFIDNNGLCLYNTKTPTYLHPATGTYTSLDLSICFPTLLLDIDWKVHDDLCGSDHFPIFSNNIGSDIDEPISRWTLNKANWAQFKFLVGCSGFNGPLRQYFSLYLQYFSPERGRKKREVIDERKKRPNNPYPHLLQAQ